MLMYGIYNAETLDKLIRTVHSVLNTTSSHGDYLWDCKVHLHSDQFMQIP